MNEQEIEVILREGFSIPAENRVDVELQNDGTFHATEVQPDLTVVQRFGGRTPAMSDAYLSPSANTLAYWEEPNLSLFQLNIFHPIEAEVLQKVAMAEQNGQEKFVLFNDGEHPELFNPLRPLGNPVADVKEELRPVRFAVEIVLENIGYRAGKRWTTGGPVEIFAS